MIKLLLLLMAILALASSLALHKHEEDTCESCPADQDKIGGYCYPKCPSGYKRNGADCFQTCLLPASKGWIDDERFCRISEYGRGAGFPRKLTDSIKSGDKGMFERCEKENGAGNCEKWGDVVYRKCKPGFSPSGCCICRPPPPDCKALGYEGGIDLSCAKKIIAGAPSCKLN